jgi:hypothetical protein
MHDSCVLNFFHILETPKTLVLIYFPSMIHLQCLMNNFLLGSLSMSVATAPNKQCIGA